MLPSVLAKQYQEGLIDYIDTTFPITNPIFKGSIQNMLHTKGAVFHEPYVSVKLPFRIYEEERAFFQSIHLKFPPYVHQQKAWERLTGNYAESTLVATGTGSGKTECFLYPILEYCYRHSGEPGIKALIIYPMNALASDQAKRIAQIVDGSKELKAAQVRVGMYVGGEETGATTMMTPDKVITKKDIMIASPPDILLTNYKMLDYLLVRPKDAELWDKNLPETLKYIAVDELHTFDGAQGTDLACLLRRLKSRLNTPHGHICCVGTSATMGAKDSAKSIRDYATDVFGEPFGDDAVITEDRLSAEEFFKDFDVVDYKMPTSAEARNLKELAQGEDEQAYLEAAVRAWFDESFSFDDVMGDDCRVNIGDRLMRHNFTHSLIAEASGSYMQSEFVVEHLSKRFPLLVNYGEELAATAIDALYALVSHARTRTETGSIRPFLYVNVQLWMRELRRLVGKVSDKDISYTLFSDLNDEQAKHYLPVINCRECGETGWVSIEEDGSVQLRDIGTFYNLFFNGDSKIRMMYPYRKEDKEIPPIERFKLCPVCMEIERDDSDRTLCSNGHETIPVWNPVPKVEGKKNTKQYLCPHCGSKSKLSIIGMRSATEVSAGISELYASKFNDDKKLLAFTDNVQDAAHHAGFYNARTWKFGLRTAVTRFANEQETEYSLGDFLNRMVAYWHGIMDNETYVANFIPESMKWMRAYKQMCESGVLEKGEDTERLVSFVDQRVKYETLLEYGILSRVGRSLEKAGCSVVSFDFEDALPRIMERVPNETGKLQGESIEVWRQIIMGLLYELKNNGGYSYYTYDAFVEADGNAYMISNKRMKWMPGEHKGRNVPKYIAINRGNKKLGYFDEPDDKSWYGRWIWKYLSAFSLDSDPRDIARIILDELTAIGVLIKTTTKSDVDVWQINPEKCTVSRDVKQLVCDKCGSQMSASGINADCFDGAFCIRKGCAGHMHIKEDSELDFYGKLYSQGEMVRIVAKEHTGLLDRDERENLERSFKSSKEDRKPWDANLLSCTPTLEMGIDIGDLSTVILSSIPPAQAGYAQRAGRGGRKDGNSLTVAVANAKPHDLYFYQDPMEMIAGSVEPPKVFLKASAVLERQFVGFCMDSWVKSGKALIPDNVGACLAKLGETGTDRFPNNFLTYVQSNMERLVRGFTKAFEETDDGVGGLDEGCVEDIRTFAKDKFAAKVGNEFHSLKSQRTAIQESIKDLKKMIRTLEAKPDDASYDEQLKELYAECAAWSSVVRKINQKDVFGFMSDSGLLPNYAFPEAGIVLKAVLTRVEKDPEKEGENKYESTTYEYSRSASSAISEFAPLNSFYAGGHRLNIDQVDVNTAEVEPWRLCPNCSHSEKADSTQNVTICPKCGSTGWSDSGQVRPMFRVQMVYSNMKEEDSLIGDESDDRAKTFYDKELLVEVDDDKDVIQAFEMDNEEFKFGYEFLQKATMREINFGEQDIVGDKLSVAGKEGIRKGFSICKYCGKIQDGGKPKHTRFCRMVKDTLGSMDAYEECLFLYRDFTTEALRLLIPATTMDSSGRRVESFVAAFMLGMKSYFGNVDHLHATVSEVPVPDAAYRKQYLVIYDSVPGGTGYLKQLMNDENGIIDILQRSLDVMTNCSCNEDENKDGCYKCLYAYRQSSHIGEISRDTAVNLVRAILSGKDNKRPIKKLAEVDSNPIFDSELERMFVGAFEKLSTTGRPIVTHPAWLGDKQGYTLQVGTSLWEIEPQVHLGAQEGIVIDSKPDFILRAKRTTGNQKEVAVFTDGFTFHKDKVEDDTKKRMAIALSGKYRVWSLSYKDVQSAYKDLGEYHTSTLAPEKMPSGSKVYRKTVKEMDAEAISPDKKGSFELLVDYLAMPDAERIFSAQAFAYGMSIVDMPLMGNQMSYDGWRNKWSEILTALNSTDEIDPFGQAIFGTWNPRQSMGNVGVMSEMSLADLTAMKAKAPSKVGIVLNDDPASRTDKYEEDWNGFWHFINVMQFADTLYFVTRVGIERSEYTALGSIMVKPDIQSPVQTGASISIDARWNDIMGDFFNDIAVVCATEMMNNGVPAPDEIGYEYVGNESATEYAMAEMAWSDKKIAWLLPEQEEYADIFKAHGWRVLLSSEKIDLDTFGGHSNE